MKNENWKLCYVSHGRAYFVEDFENAWGDDWNDAPYEHNAGEPYGEYVVLRFSGEWDEPFENHTNSPYSVEGINNKAVPWLTPCTWANGKAQRIFAGVTLREFIDMIHAGGGNVYIPLKNISDYL